MLLVFFQDVEIDEEFDLLVLASDGLWDVVPNEVMLFLLCLLIVSDSLAHLFSHIVSGRCFACSSRRRT